MDGLMKQIGPFWWANRGFTKPGVYYYWRNKNRRILPVPKYVVLPYLHVFIDLGFLQARTEVLHRCCNRDCFVVIGLEGKLFGKGFSFDLYRPHQLRIY